MSFEIATFVNDLSPQDLSNFLGEQLQAPYFIGTETTELNQHLSVQALTGTQWALIGVLLLIPFGIPITLILALLTLLLTVLVTVLSFIVLYLSALTIYLTFITITSLVVRFYARYAVRIAFLAYIALWTLVGYGAFDNNPVVTVVELWKEFVIWGFLKLNLNSIIPYESIFEVVKTQWFEANVFDLDSTTDLVWIFLIVWPVVFTAQSEFAIEFYLIAPLVLGIYLLNQNLFVRQPDTLEELRAGFSYFDYNGDGFITYEDSDLADEAYNQDTTPDVVIEDEDNDDLDTDDQVTDDLVPEGQVSEDVQDQEESIDKPEEPPKRASSQEIDTLMKELNRDENGRVDFNTFTTWFAGGCPEEIIIFGLKYCTEEGFPTLLSYWYYINRLLIFDPSFLREDWKPTIDFNLFIVLMPLSLAQIALSPALKVPAFLWSVTVSPAILFGLWYDKVYGQVTRILLGRVKELLVQVLGFAIVILMFVFNDTYKAFQMVWHLVWTSGWIAFFEISTGVWNATLGLFPITWEYTLQAGHEFLLDSLYLVEFIFLALPWYFLQILWYPFWWIICFQKGCEEDQSEGGVPSKKLENPWKR